MTSSTALPICFFAVLRIFRFHFSDLGKRKKLQQKPPSFGNRWWFEAPLGPEDTFLG